MACAISEKPLNQRIIGMTAGVVVFIAGYTKLTSSAWFQRKFCGGPFEKALTLATRIRSSMAVVGLLGALSLIPGLKLSPSPNLLWIDLYAGFCAGRMVEAFGKLNLIRNLRYTLTSPDPYERAKSWWLGDMNSTIPTFLWTITEGLLLSILMLSIAIIIFLIGKAMRRYHRQD